MQKGWTEKNWDKSTKGILHSLVKVNTESSGKGEGARIFMVTLSVFPSNGMHAEALFSRKWMNICLMMGSSKQIPYFALIV